MIYMGSTPEETDFEQKGNAQELRRCKQKKGILTDKQIDNFLITPPEPRSYSTQGVVCCVAAKEGRKCTNT